MGGLYDEITGTGALVGVVLLSGTVTVNNTFYSVMSLLLSPYLSMTLVKTTPIMEVSWNAQGR